MLVSDVEALLGEAGRGQIERLQPALACLRPDEMAPSMRAADAILRIIDGR